MSDLPSTLEDRASQIPALQVLINLGWEYLTPEEALAARGGRTASVLLDSILEEQLRALNRIEFRGRTEPFSEGNIATAITRLKDERFDGLIRTNEKLYDRLTLGTTLPQTIAGDTKSFPLHYVDWRDWSRNKFHVTAEFEVTRTSSQEIRRPDIVLFVNGIPLAVIENKSPNAKVEGGGAPIDQAISQMIRNQGVLEIPRLFTYVQLVLALAVGEAKYATVGTSAKYWATWKEEHPDEKALKALVNQRLSADLSVRLFSGEFAEARVYFDKLAKKQREPTEQDRLLHALCRPDRLMELAERYVLLDGGDKKIARYQQYFCVRRILDRIAHRDPDGSRRGGVVWHTQGSGKSLTMVMLAKGLALDLPRQGADDFKVVLVTDRIDLDDQIYGTFKNCGTTPVQATTGKHLAKLLAGHQSRIITTVIDKFETALDLGQRLDSDNIFALVDEGHRGQFGPTHAKMRRVLPKACFIGFTGTPVFKKEKSTVATFGGLIHRYTIGQAVLDKAVVELLYEGRDIPQTVDAAEIDRLFEEWTEGKTAKQKADLKKKYATSGVLNKVERRVMATAWDISKHFSQNWKGTPFKAQLVAPDKATALLYKSYLDLFGKVTSEVLISSPDDREGNEEVDQAEELSEADMAKVVAFWNRMMAKHGGPAEYQRNLINAFTHSEDPEIIIVVYKLITGFDAPRNTVLYLCRQFKNPVTLLQAIARVNRLYEGKEFGYTIDYVGVLQSLDKALDLYGKLAEFDEADLTGTVIPVTDEVNKLAQRHSDLRDIFKSITNSQDQEAYERLLADEALRERFYQRLSAFSRTLGLALSTVAFHEQTPAAKVVRYKDDLKFFQMLRRSVQRRYQEVIDYDEYDSRIRKLLNQHIGTAEVELLVQPLNLLDASQREAELARMGSDASRADAIAHQTKKVITAKMQEDPAFYKKFSRMLQDVIDDWRARRLSDAEYLLQARDISDKVVNRTGDSLPSRLVHEEVAKAFFGEVREVFEKYACPTFDAVELAADAALAIDRIVLERRGVDWTHNPDVQNRMKTDIEDYLFDLKDEQNISLTLEDIDQILEHCIDIARVRRP